MEKNIVMLSFHEQPLKIPYSPNKYLLKNNNKEWMSMNNNTHRVVKFDQVLSSVCKQVINV